MVSLDKKEGMKSFKVELTWQECGVVTVYANDVQEAVDFVISDNCPLPDSEYFGEIEIDFVSELAEGSFKVINEYDVVNNIVQI